MTREYVVELGGGPMDLDRLRRAFGELMDKAAHDVQCAGYEQDDSIVERYVDLRYEGEKTSLCIEVQSLSDETRLLHPFHTAHERQFGKSFPQRPVEMLSARAKCLVYGQPQKPI